MLDTYTFAYLFLGIGMQGVCTVSGFSLILFRVSVVISLLECQTP